MLCVPDCGPMQYAVYVLLLYVIIMLCYVQSVPDFGPMQRARPWLVPDSGPMQFPDFGPMQRARPWLVSGLRSDAVGKAQ